MGIDLWTERYRPATLDDYVWRDPSQRERVEQWLSTGALPHLMLSGPPGVGKTSLAKLLLHLLDVPLGDILEINASRVRGVDDIQAQWDNFVPSYAIGTMKYVIFEECDAMSQTAQKMLRAGMEVYAGSCRVIFTCNYPQAIIPALHDRCQKMPFSALDRTEFTVRVGRILNAERVDYDIETLTHYVAQTFPSLRKCIGVVQDNSITGRLLPPGAADDGRIDYRIDMVKLFQAGQLTAARKLIVASAMPEDYPEIYRFLYQNLPLFGRTQIEQDDALLVIADGVRDHTIVADVEINLSATLVRLTRITAGR